jgi:hypothetical protein
VAWFYCDTLRLANGVRSNLERSGLSLVQGICVHGKVSTDHGNMKAWVRITSTSEAAPNRVGGLFRYFGSQRKAAVRW